MDFNNWLDDELKARHLSIQAFSNKSGLARSTVSKILSGQRKVTAYTAAKIATGLNISTNLVFEKTGLVPESEGRYKIHPLLETAIEEIARLDKNKQILAAKLIRVVTEEK